MFRPRVVPVLTISDNNLVKTFNFKNPRYIGDPINAIKIFNEKEVDELIIIDIDATKKNIEPNYSLIEDMCSECFMPLVYGGGIKNIEQARRIFSLGIEKICIQSIAFSNSNFIKDLNNEFGKQSIILSMDLKKDLFKKYRFYNNKTKRCEKFNYINKVQNLIDLGVGELLINSVNKDGSMSGPEKELIQEFRQNIDIPLIYIGGISSLEDIQNAVKAGANAIGASSFFIFYGPHKAVLLTYPSYDKIEEIFFGSNH